MVRIQDVQLLKTEVLYSDSTFTQFVKFHLLFIVCLPLSPAEVAQLGSEIRHFIVLKLDSHIFSKNVRIFNL